MAEFSVSMAAMTGEPTGRDNAVVGRDASSDVRDLVERAEESLELRARMAHIETKLAGPPPWWQNPKTVTLLASMLAAVVPATTALNAYLERESNLAMAAQQQQHAMRMDYVRTVLDSEVAERDRQSRLRLLLALLPSEDPLFRWATGELQRNEHLC